MQRKTNAQNDAQLTSCVFNPVATSFTTVYAYDAETNEKPSIAPRTIMKVNIPVVPIELMYAVFGKGWLCAWILADASPSTIRYKAAFIA